MTRTYTRRKPSIAPGRGRKPLGHFPGTIHMPAWAWVRLDVLRGKTAQGVYIASILPRIKYTTSNPPITINRKPKP